MKKETALIIIAYLFIALFAYTAADKLGAYSIYLYDLRRSPELGRFAVPISILVPGAELISATLLLFPSTRRIGFWIATILMITFTFYVAYVLMFAPELPCTCGGIIRELSWPAHLALNIGFTIMGITALRMSSRSKDIGRGKTLAIS